MKIVTTLKFALVILLFTSCVQKSYNRTVVYTLDVSELKDVKKVGIRGENNPLSWQNDLAMKEIVKDSLYTITVTGETEQLFTEVKFTVNDEFELKEKPNRRVVFDEIGKTTKYHAVFDVAK